LINGEIIGTIRNLGRSQIWEISSYLGKTEIGWEWLVKKICHEHIGIICAFNPSQCKRLINRRKEPKDCLDDA